jgi:hypothetical protein
MRVFSFLRGAVVVGAALCILMSANGQIQMRKPPPLVRIAELEINPGQLIEYKRALSDEIATSVHDEPGVLMLYAVSVKDHPVRSESSRRTRIKQHTNPIYNRRTSRNIKRRLKGW